MHKDRIAEHLLGLVTDEYRAVSTVGDLMEHARDRGALWFWTNVLRTASALVWRTFMSEPGKFLKLGFRGSVRACFFANLAQLAAVLGALAIFGILRPHEPLPWTRILQGWGLWVYYAMIFGTPILAMFQTGRWAARKAPGNELTAGLVLISMQLVLGGVLGVVILSLDAHGIKPPSGSWSAPADVAPLVAATNIAGLLATFAGAVWVRWRAVSS